MTGQNSSNNDPKQPISPPKPDIPPDRKFPEKPDWLPQDPPHTDPPDPKVPEIDPQPTEDPSHDPGTPPPFKE